jgi:D-arabinan exo alpha-(1,3)/(1,5)-arabinofuranosidase (non-reducing end)
MLSGLTKIHSRKTGRFSSWDKSGRNADLWIVPAKSSVVLADIPGPAQITHIWMTQLNHYRECLLRITYDGSSFPSVLVPLGDFFCMGHGLVNSFQNALFSASTFFPYQFNKPCALNCYAPMPFGKRALVELVNESDEAHRQYFYVDYETLEAFPEEMGYFHAEFRRANPFNGWAPEITVNVPEVDVVNAERTAWENNYVILETKGRGHYLGCNLSVTNFTRNWWGEGDDMIWVDGYKWPPDLHGTGSEDYFNQAWGMQPNAFLHNGSSIFEGGTVPSPEIELYRGDSGYQTSYVFHIENPVRFSREIKATIEIGHANHLGNEVSSVAYWYADKPSRAVEVPDVARRLPVQRANNGKWLKNPERECPGKPVVLTDEMKVAKEKWAESHTG